MEDQAISVKFMPYISDLSSALLSQGKGASFVPSPASGVLSPFNEEIIEISGYSDIWGVYSDNLICRVSSYMHTTNVDIQLYFMFVRSTFNQLSPRRQKYFNIALVLRDE